MTDVTPEPRTPLPPDGSAPSRRFGDALVAILLLLVHPVLILIVLVVVGFRAMGVGACAYEGCGHQAWLDWVMGAADVASLAVLIAAAVCTRRRYVRH